MTGVERLTNTVNGVDANLYLAPLGYVPSIQTIQANLLPASTNPAFHSCDMQLADNPSARQASDSAASYAINHGLLSPSQLAAPTTWRMLTDDLSAGEQLAFFVVEGTGQTEAQVSAAGASASPPGRSAVLVVIDALSHQPTNAGLIALPS
jgi:hypothetical protein